MNCGHHPEREAEAVCCECRVGICGSCRNKMFGRNYCDGCAGALEQKMLNQGPGGAGQQRPVVVHHAPAAGYPVVHEHKSPGAAAALSIIFPGAGQLYCERVGRGIGIFFATAVLFPVGVGVLLWAAQIYDAYTCAKDYNRRASLAPHLPPP